MNLECRRRQREHAGKMVDDSFFRHNYLSMDNGDQVFPHINCKHNNDDFLVV